MLVGELQSTMHSDSSLPLPEANTDNDDCWHLQLPAPGRNVGALSSAADAQLVGHQHGCTFCIMSQHARLASLKHDVGNVFSGTTIALGGMLGGVRGLPTRSWTPASALRDSWEGLLTGLQRSSASGVTDHFQQLRTGSGGGRRSSKGQPRATKSAQVPPGLL